MRFNAYIIFLTLAFTPAWLPAQTPADVTAPVTVTAEFDPAVVQAGGKVCYRVNVYAAEAAIGWPDQIVAAPELQFGPTARGQMLLPQFGGEHPLTSFVQEVSTTSAGTFGITNLSLTVYGQPVLVPSASVSVVSNLPTPPVSRALSVEISATNLYVGQPFRVRLRLPAGPGNQLDFLREIRLNDTSLVADKLSLRQSAQGANQNGQSVASTTSELTVTPTALGAITFTAQAFTAGRDFSGPITITGQAVLLGGGASKYALLVTEPTIINVRPLPLDGELPGFTGAIGKFYLEPPHLSTNQMRVGEPVHLKISFVSEGELTRLVPPTVPRSRDWQIIEDKTPATGFTLIPLTDEAKSTPAIPFSSFDPATGKYVNLTIPSLPVTISAEGLPLQLATFDEANIPTQPLRLSDPAPTAGKRVASLKPLQTQAWFIALQLLPVAGFLALWQWDCRRRFLEAHPEIVRRRKALRALKRLKHAIQIAANVGDTAAFTQHAAEAMRIAVAPHYPANPQALVCGDVLAQLAAGEQTGGMGETVRAIFAAADAQFAQTPPAPKDLLAVQTAVLEVLKKLEGRL